jgi:hypothetical protein
MTHAERKRSQETAILEMVYDPAEFHTVVPSERPDFLLQHWPSARPFGVEVTQLFPSESHARLNLIPGYMHRLWSGEPHMTRKDVKILKSIKVTVSDKDGNVKQTDLPAILTEQLSVAEFRRQLANAILAKSDKGYDPAGFTHVNLIILDWFHLDFDPNKYRTERLFNDDVRSALRDGPFREVYLVVSVTERAPESETNERVASFRVVPLQMLLALERMFCTGHVIAEKASALVADVEHLNWLTIDHVTRVQGYGAMVLHEGRPFLHYKASLLEISDEGLQVRDLRDYDESDVQPCGAACARLEPELEAAVLEQVNLGTFESGFTLEARRNFVDASTTADDDPPAET